MPNRRRRQVAGHFIEASFTNDAGSRDYKLYVPTRYHGQPLPLVVMLHGCTQDPDDFAAGTRMNEIAESNSCFAVYPSQAESANKSRCWNWFDSLNQQRDKGEPSIIVGITREVIAQYHIDSKQVFVAGMSAGGAMAVIMAATYPELFAGVGSHSGMPYKAAQTLYTAMSAMRRGAPTLHPLGSAGIPIIVFQGDKDRRVNRRNSEQILSQWMSSNPSQPAAGAVTAETKETNGRSYQRTTYPDAAGHTAAELWVVEGAGHAWSGGNSLASHTDSLGPDASSEMIRFFLGGPKKPAPRRDRRLLRGLVTRCLRALRLKRAPA
jgi:poly(hydroxyalkanoate) depolymerase family esterase